MKIQILILGFKGLNGEKLAQLGGGPDHPKRVTQLDGSPFKPSQLSFCFSSQRFIKFHAKINEKFACPGFASDLSIHKNSSPDKWA